MTERENKGLVLYRRIGESFQIDSHIDVTVSNIVASFRWGEEFVDLVPIADYPKISNCIQASVGYYWCLESHGNGDHSAMLSLRTALDLDKADFDEPTLMLRCKMGKRTMVPDFVHLSTPEFVTHSIVLHFVDKTGENPEQLFYLDMQDEDEIHYAGIKCSYTFESLRTMNGAALRIKSPQQHRIVRSELL